MAADGHSHDHGQLSDDGGSMVGQQIGAMAVLTLVGVVSVLIPYVHPAIYKNKRLIDVVSAFGGGTFLALGLFHLLPESTENIEETGWFPKAKSGHNYPISYFLAFFGFAFILFCEKVIFSSQDVEFLHFHGDEEGHGHHHHHGEGHSHSHGPKTNTTQPSTGAGLHSHGEANDHYHAQHDEHDHDYGHHHHDHDHDHAHEHGHGHNHDEKAQKASVLEQKEDELKEAMNVRARVGSLLKAAQTESRTLPHDAQPNGSPRGSFLETVGKQSPNALAAYCMMIALSVHNTFEGMVVGTVRSPQTLWMLVGIVTAHHWVAGLALSMGFIKQKIERSRAYAALAIFVFSLPFGQLLGMWIATGGPGWSGIFNAIAAGTILYVATCEIIAEEFAMGTHRRSKFVAFLLGALLVAGLTIIHVQVGHGDGHDHNHDHDHDHNGHDDHDVDEPGHDHDHDHNHGGDDHDHNHDHNNDNKGGGGGDDHSHDHDHHDDHFNFRLVNRVPPVPKTQDGAAQELPDWWTQ